VYARKQARDKQRRERHGAVDLRDIADEVEPDRIAQDKIQRGDDQHHGHDLTKRLTLARGTEHAIARALDGGGDGRFVGLPRVEANLRAPARKRRAHTRDAAQTPNRVRHAFFAMGARHARNRNYDLFRHTIHHPSDNTNPIFRMPEEYKFDVKI